MANYLQTLFEIISLFGSIYFAAIVFATLWFKKDKKLTVNFILAFIATNAIAYGLKFISQIPRPLSPRAPEPLSPTLFYETAFPSGHSARAFLYSVFLSEKFGKYYQIVFYIMAALTAISRIYLEAHFPIDVIVGSIIGFAVSWLCLKYQDRIFKLLKF